MAVKNGDHVKIEYTGTLDDGTVFDSTSHGDHTHPLEFEVGAGMILPAFEENVIGMNVGDEKEFKLSPEEAYGNINPEAKKEFPKTMLPEGPEPKAGMTLMLSSPDGHHIPVKIVEVTDDKIVLDLNHPLAGQTLHFKIKLVA